MTEDKANEIVHSIVMSDHFDDLIVYRLEKSLEWTMSQLKDYEYDPNDMFSDLKYCRSLITVLRAFTLDDYEEEAETLDSFQEKLLADYY